MEFMPPTVERHVVVGILFTNNLYGSLAAEQYFGCAQYKKNSCSNKSLIYFAAMKQLQNEALQRPDLATYKEAKKIPVIVVLDNVRSGLNVGAIFRTCDAFSMEAIYLCGITVKPPHAEIMKTALGATESVQWFYFEKMELALNEIKEKGYQVIAVEQTDQSKSLAEIEFKSLVPLALIFGNEMRGISPEVLLQCDSSIEIPQSGIKHSLNVATSAGIVLWECYRQYR